MAQGARPSFHGYEREVRTFSGAAAVRVSHLDEHLIPEHRHDWPTLTVHVLGCAEELYDGGAALLARPSLILHPAGSWHADRVSAEGLETFGIVFDPAWLGADGMEIRLDRPTACLGGPAGAAATRLKDAWLRRGSSEQHLRGLTARFLRSALAHRAAPAPNWVGKVAAALAVETPPRTQDLAREIGLNPAWLARAYRQAAGEGLQEAVRRRRVARAVQLLRFGTSSLADAAASAGFSDQSHMNRCFRAVLGCTPATVRAEYRQACLSRNKAA